MTSDIHQLVEVIATITSAAPLIAFGHSMGSLLTQSLMQTHGGMLAGAILCDTAGSIPSLTDADSEARRGTAIGSRRI